MYCVPKARWPTIVGAIHHTPTFVLYCNKEGSMWERLRSVWTVPDLRNKILFTLGMLLIFRILAHITVPLSLTEQTALKALFNTNKNQNLSQLLGLLDVFSGGSLQTFSIVAMGVYPYITATIVMQL